MMLGQFFSSLASALEYLLTLMKYWASRPARAALYVLVVAPPLVIVALWCLIFNGKLCEAQKR